MRSMTRSLMLALQVALLRGTQIVVEDDQVGVRHGCRTDNLFHFAFANQRGGIGPIAALQDFAHQLCAGARRQLAQFSKRFFRPKEMR